MLQSKSNEYLNDQDENKTSNRAPTIKQAQNVKNSNAFPQHHRNGSKNLHGNYQAESNEYQHQFYQYQLPMTTVDPLTQLCMADLLYFNSSSHSPKEQYYQHQIPYEHISHDSQGSAIGLYSKNFQSYQPTTGNQVLLNPSSFPGSIILGQSNTSQQIHDNGFEKSPSHYAAEVRQFNGSKSSDSVGSLFNSNPLGPTFDPNMTLGGGSLVFENHPSNNNNSQQQIQPTNCNISLFQNDYMQHEEYVTAFSNTCSQSQHQQQLSLMDYSLNEYGYDRPYSNFTIPEYHRLFEGNTHDSAAEQNMQSQTINASMELFDLTSPVRAPTDNSFRGCISNLGAETQRPNYDCRNGLVDMNGNPKYDLSQKISIPMQSIDKQTSEHYKYDPNFHCISANDRESHEGHLDHMKSQQQLASGGGAFFNFQNIPTHFHVNTTQNMPYQQAHYSVEHGHGLNAPMVSHVNPNDLLSPELFKSLQIPAPLPPQMIKHFELQQHENHNNKYMIGEHNTFYESFGTSVPPNHHFQLNPQNVADNISSNVLNGPSQSSAYFHNYSATPTINSEGQSADADKHHSINFKHSTLPIGAAPNSSKKKNQSSIGNNSSNSSKKKSAAAAMLQYSQNCFSFNSNPLNTSMANNHNVHNSHQHHGHAIQPHQHIVIGSKGSSYKHIGSSDMQMIGNIPGSLLHHQILSPNSPLPSSIQPNVGGQSGAFERGGSGAPSVIGEDGKVYTKPPYSYAALISRALRECQDSKLTLSGIYDWIKDHFPYYRTAEAAWQVRR